MFVRANFVDIYLQRMRDRSMRSGTELAREIKLTDWSMAGNLSNRSSGVQIPRVICTRLERYIVLCEVQLDNKSTYNIPSIMQSKGSYVSARGLSLRKQTLSLLFDLFPFDHRITSFWGCIGRAATIMIGFSPLG